MLKRILLIFSFITSFLGLDLQAQTITNVTSSDPNDAYNSGSTVNIQITFSQTVFVTGTPQLTLETGATDAVVNYSSGSGSNTLTFNYTISPTDNTDDLNYISTTALTLNGGTITDGDVTSANLTLPGLLAAGSLATNKNIVIDNITQAPTIISPTTGIASTNNFTFSYLLPEAPTPSSVHLTFTNLSSTVVADLTLSNLTSASFSINLANIVPSANIASTTSSTVPDGTYNIQLSYRDALGNPVNNSSAVLVSIDNVTQAPSILLPATGFVRSNFVFSYLLPEAPLPSSVHLTFTNLSSTVVADLTLSDLTSASFSLNLANILPSANIASTTSSTVPDGSYNIQLSYRDILGNTVTNSSTTSITVDSVTIPLTNSNLPVPVFDANSSSIQLSYTLEEDPLTNSTNLIFQSASDTITLTLNNLLSNSLTINTQNINIDSIITSATQSTIPEGTYSVTLRYQDELGNSPSTITRNNFSTNIPPNVSVTSSASSLTNTSPIPISITFSESVTGFTSGDITIGNGTVSGFTGSGASYTANIIPTSDGSVTVDIASAVAFDSAGNSNNAATRLTRTFDGSLPSATITSTSSSNTKDSPIPIIITFTESVTGFIQGDITVGNGTISGFTGSGSSYSANIIPTSDGCVTVDIASSAAVDIAGNANNAAARLTRTFDGTLPSVTITSTSSSNTKDSPIPISITFSETVTGFIEGDVTVGNGTLSGFTGSGASYSASIIPTSNGNVTVDISSGIAIDVTGNSNIAATRLTRTYDSTPPSVTITSSLSNNTNNTPIPISIAFSESVTGFTADDITITNGVLSDFSGSANSYSANITPSADAQVTASILSLACTDAALNGNTSGTFSITYNSHLKTLTPPIINTSNFSNRFETKLSGTADTNVTVEIFDNNQSIGTTTSDNAGSWTLNLATPLIAGEHSLTAISSDTYTNVSTSSAATVLIIGSTAFDFNKDGISEVVLYKTTSKDLSYNILNEKEASQTTIKFTGKSLKPAIADYNGNGVAEAAVVTVSKKTGVSWLFADETTKQITSEFFGLSGDKILTGCNFSSETKSSMAVIRGSTLIFKTRGENGENQLTLPTQYKSANLRGCGDVNADGLSEIFYLIQDRSSKRRSFNFVAIDISNKVIKEYKKTGRFVQAIADNVYGNEVYDILLKNTTKKASYSTYDGSNDQKVTALSVSGSRSSNLTCVDSTGQYVSCLYFTGAGKKLSVFLPLNNNTVRTNISLQSNLMTSAVNLY